MAAYEKGAAKRRKIPQFVAYQYGGTTRAFKAAKRRDLAAAKKALSQLYRGCAWFPCTNKPMEEIRRQIAIVEKAISAKEWGR